MHSCLLQLLTVLMHRVLARQRRGLHEGLSLRGLRPQAGRLRCLVQQVMARSGRWHSCSNLLQLRITLTPCAGRLCCMRVLPAQGPGASARVAPGCMLWRVVASQGG